MEQLIGFGAIMFVVVLISTAALVVAVKVIIKAFSRSGNPEGGNLFSQAENGIERILKPGHGLTHGQKIGAVIDATDSLGTLLTQGGYMPATEWQPLADKITTAVAQTKHVAPVEAPVA